MIQHRRRFLGLLVGGLGMVLLSSMGYTQTPDKPSNKEVLQLFDKWNAALQTGKADEVVKLYAPDAILLPTVSNKVRHNPAEIKDYFEHFLPKHPIGRINESNIRTYGGVVINSGTYTFTLTKDGQKSDVPARFTFVYRKVGDSWLIAEHHSSAMPEK